MSEKTKKHDDNFNSIVDSKSKSMKIAEQIMQAIDEGDYEPGDKLPSEIELAEEMDVSRPSVREALSGLNAVGVVEARKGSGTYVSNPQCFALPKLLSDLAREGSGTYSGNSSSGQNFEHLGVSMLEEETSYLDIIRARESIETAALELIISEVTEDDLENIKKTLEEMKEYSNTRDYEKYMDADHDFHRQLIHISSNRLVHKSMEPLVSSINSEVYRELVRNYYLNNEDRIKRCYNVHESIYEAIKEKDYFEAKSAMHQHWSLMQEAL